MEILPIAKVNNHFSTKNMRVKDDLNQEMKEGKNILLGTVAWDAENCWVAIWTAYGWIKHMVNETVEQANERALKMTYQSIYSNQTTAEVDMNNPQDGNMIFDDQTGEIKVYLSASTWCTYAYKETEETIVEVLPDVEKIKFHVEPEHKKDTIENTIVKQNVFQKALDKITTTVKIKLPSKD